MRTLRPASYTGLDLNPAGVAFRQKGTGPAWDFVQGDAEDLPFVDQSFDAVINVRSLALLPSVSPFPRRSGARWRPAGHFRMRICVPAGHCRVGVGDCRRRRWGYVSGRVVNAEVLRGIEKNTHWSLNLVDRHQPAFLRPFGREFAVAQGSQIYRDLQRGELSFRMYWFAKD